MTDRAQKLRALIRASGLTHNAYAETVLAGRSGRTVSGWLAGRPIPKSAAAWIDKQPAPSEVSEPTG